MFGGSVLTSLHDASSNGAGDKSEMSRKELWGDIALVCWCPRQAIQTQTWGQLAGKFNDHDTSLNVFLIG